MQQCQGRFSKMFLLHTTPNKIDNFIPNAAETLLTQICATSFQLAEGGRHGMVSWPCDCALCQYIRMILLVEEVFAVMVCSRLLSSSMTIVF